jgi:aldehyde:ferredoxin oxidoreductase
MGADSETLSEGTLSKGARPQDHSISHHEVDLSKGSVCAKQIPCADLEDVLGGIARGFRILEDCAVTDAYSPDAVLVMNIGCLSGSAVMTGLRVYFHAFSPLKRSGTGLPSAMWSAGSGKFGTQLRGLKVEEVLFRGRAEHPSLLHISLCPETGDPVFRIEDARDLVGASTHAKIKTLHGRYPDGHFAVIGPAGENYEAVRYGAIALSTENQLKSGDAKSRFCGRGGMGSIMGSKNLFAIVAELPAGKLVQPSEVIKKLNKQIASGDGSRRFREPKTKGMGGTWANCKALNPSHAMPEMNFSPTGTDASDVLYRENVEEMDEYVIRGEACFRCGIRCHKNVYDTNGNGKAGRFRAKVDFEPLNLLSSNIGIFDVDQACDLIELTDALGVDSISAGVSLSYAMEYNKRAKPEDQIAGGVEYGDFEGARRVLEETGLGKLPLLGQGVLRMSEELGETTFAMQSKGMEFPAYLPQTNPGYPWALAGGHMSMRTYLLLVNERETSIDYWVDTITDVTRGLSINRDDILGLCKFSGLSDDEVVKIIHAVTGIEISVDELRDTLMRTILRGYRLERRQGFKGEDYSLPAMAHEKHPSIDLPYFNSPEFFEELRTRVLAKFDSLVESTDLDG